MRSPSTDICLLVLGLMITLASPYALPAQSPELVEARARLKALNTALSQLDQVSDQQLETAVAREVDTGPRGEFETTVEHLARLGSAAQVRLKLEGEFRRKKTDRRRALQAETETLIGVPYPAPVRIRMGTYDADTETFPFTVRATGDSGTIAIPRNVAREIKTSIASLKQTGYWRLLKDGTERLIAVGVAHAAGPFIGEARGQKLEADGADSLAILPPSPYH